jgi:hypothetical protein
MDPKNAPNVFDQQRRLFERGNVTVGRHTNTDIPLSRQCLMLTA